MDDAARIAVETSEAMRAEVGQQIDEVVFVPFGEQEASVSDLSMVLA
jgi:O-acetyl-ADP-ribose deacetylase (regulator of RNase III)